jgi:hypothetical protein
VGQRYLTPYDLASGKDEICAILSPASLTLESLKQAIILDEPSKLVSLLSHKPSLLNQQDDLVSLHPSPPLMMADVSSPLPQYGSTLLMMAVVKNRERCVKELVRLGADQSIRDNVCLFTCLLSLCVTLPTADGSHSF